MRVLVRVWVSKPTFVTSSARQSPSPPPPPKRHSFRHHWKTPALKINQTDYDGAEPGAGSVAADNLLRLSGYFGGEDGARLRIKAAGQLAEAFARPEAPQAFPELAASLVTAILGPKQVCLVTVVRHTRAWFVTRHFCQATVTNNAERSTQHKAENTTMIISPPPQQSIPIS